MEAGTCLVLGDGTESQAAHFVAKMKAEVKGGKV